MKKIVFLLIAAGVLLVGMASCNKEEETNTNTTPQDTTQTTIQKHNVELVYKLGDDHNLALDTIFKYNADPTVDTIFMVPQPYNTFSTLQTSTLKEMIPYFRERKNINPNKVWGKGELMLRAESVRDNPEIIAFFSDTLKYNVTYNYQK